jgi:hypothetical protein
MLFILRRNISPSSSGPRSKPTKKLLEAGGKSSAVSTGLLCYYFVNCAYHEVIRLRLRTLCTFCVSSIISDLTTKFTNNQISSIKICGRVWYSNLCSGEPGLESRKRDFLSWLKVPKLPTGKCCENTLNWVTTTAFHIYPNNYSPFFQPFGRQKSKRYNRK